MTLPTTSVSSALRHTFAPTGVLRASINLGNPILACRDAASGDVAGVSVDMARACAQRLGVDMTTVVFDGAGKSVAAVKDERADIGFFAIDPLRGEGILFTAPYVLIEGSYLVPAMSPLQDNANVDHRDQRVAVAAGSAYDLFLTRELRRSPLVRAQGADGVLQALYAGDVEVAAGIRQSLFEEAERLKGSVRLLPGRFMVIQQAMGTPQSRGGEAQAWLAAFVEDMKASGFVADALRRHQVQGGSVAPAAAAN